MRRWMAVLAGLVMALGIYSVALAGAADRTAQPEAARGSTRAAVTSCHSAVGDSMAAMHQAMGQMDAMHGAMAKMTPGQMARLCQAHLRAAQGGNQVSR